MFVLSFLTKIQTQTPNTITKPSEESGIGERAQEQDSLSRLNTHTFQSKIKQNPFPTSDHSLWTPFKFEPKFLSSLEMERRKWIPKERSWNSLDSSFHCSKSLPLHHLSDGLFGYHEKSPSLPCFHSPNCEFSSWFCCFW